MKTQKLAICLMLAMINICCASTPEINTTKIADEVRAEQIKDMKWGMFICWSFSSFSGSEWTPTRDKDATYFKATGCDTDQWCKTAKEAGMGYILFLSKHHDGFCLWDTATTDKKVTNSELGIDVLAKLRKSCDKYGIKLALYFSEGDCNWPGSTDGAGGNGGGSNPEVKKAQLKELLTNYGPIEFWWMDHATGNGGVSHEDTVKWMHKFQPNTFVGFNHGPAAGRICLREAGRPGKLGDASATIYNKHAEGSYKGYHVAEFTYPILPPHSGGAYWFYSLPIHDNLCHPAEKLYKDYLEAIKCGNIFSIDIGPNYEGKIRDIDVKTLRKVGRYISGEDKLPLPPVSQGKTVSASSTHHLAGYEADKAVDGNENTRWSMSSTKGSGWLVVDLGKATEISRIVIKELYQQTTRFTIEAQQADGSWKVLWEDKLIGANKDVKIKPATAQKFRLNILESKMANPNSAATINEFQLFATVDEN